MERCGCPFAARDEGEEEWEARAEAAAEGVRWPRRRARRGPPQVSDPVLTVRARELLRKYLPGIAPPASITWSMRMRCTRRYAKWGVCQPSTRAIRISAELKKVPGWVRDGVIVHELVHLKVPNHGPDFHRLVNRYPLTAKKKAFLREYMRGIESDASEAGVRRQERVSLRSKPSAAARVAPRIQVAVGDVVTFGRPRGQKTRARVVRVGPATALVELLETRGAGRGGFVGSRWRVRLAPGVLSVVTRGGRGART